MLLIFHIINTTQFEKFRIPLENLELQNKFANFVQQIDKSKYIIIIHIPDGVEG